MKTSDVIDKLTKMIKKHGDLDVAVGTEHAQSNCTYIGLTYWDCEDDCWIDEEDIPDNINSLINTGKMKKQIRLYG
jgi:hypothetical protein